MRDEVDYRDFESLAPAVDEDVNAAPVTVCQREAGFRLSGKAPRRGGGVRTRSPGRKSND